MSLITLTFWKGAPPAVNWSGLACAAIWALLAIAVRPVSSDLRSLWNQNPHPRKMRRRVEIDDPPEVAE
jgi:hypothetical protein